MALPYDIPDELRRYGTNIDGDLSTLVRRAADQIEDLLNSFETLNQRYLALADTRRCEFAAALAAGLLANMVSLGNASFSVIAAVEHADALIAELEKKRDG